MPPNPVGIYRLIVKGEIHGQRTQTAFHFRSGPTSTHTIHTSEMAAILNDFRINALPKYAAFCHQDWSHKGLYLVTLNPRPGFLIEETTTTVGGFQGDDCLPSHDAGLLIFRTGVAGRSGHGRIYLPGVHANSVSAGRLGANLLSLLSDFGNTLVQRYGASGSQSFTRMGIFSRKLGVTRDPLNPKELDYNLAGFFTITTAIPRVEVATMRRRKLHRGQ